MRKRENVMLAHKATEKLIKTLGDTFYTQPKLNGVRCLATVQDTQVRLFSSTNLEKPFLQHIKKDMAIFPDGIYDGELYTHNKPWNWINSRASCSTNRHTEESLLNFCIFDIKENKIQSDRIKHLQDLNTEFRTLCTHTSFLRTDWASSGTWQENLDRYVNLGYEGIIFRHRNGIYQEKRTNYLLKLKLTVESAFTISEIIQGTGWCYDRCGAIEVTNGLITFKVGTGPLLTADNRLEIWDNRTNLIGKTLIIRHELLKTKNDYPVSTSAVKIK